VDWHTYQAAVPMHCQATAVALLPTRAKESACCHRQHSNCDRSSFFLRMFTAVSRQGPDELSSPRARSVLPGSGPAAFRSRAVSVLCTVYALTPSSPGTPNTCNRCPIASAMALD
jgi:hypothetical protein